MKMSNLSIRKKATLLSAVALLMVGGLAFGQDLITGVNNAVGTVNSARDSVKNLIFAIAGIVGLIGAVRVYIKWNSGDQDVQKAAMGWFGAAIFLVVVAATVGSFFGN